MTAPLPEVVARVVAEGAAARRRGEPVPMRDGMVWCSRAWLAGWEQAGETGEPRQLALWPGGEAA